MSPFIDVYVRARARTWSIGTEWWRREEVCIQEHPDTSPTCVNTVPRIPIGVGKRTWRSLLVARARPFSWVWTSLLTPETWKRQGCAGSLKPCRAETLVCGKTETTLGSFTWNLLLALLSSRRWRLIRELALGAESSGACAGVQVGGHHESGAHYRFGCCFGWMSGVGPAHGPCVHSAMSSSWYVELHLCVDTRRHPVCRSRGVSQ
jgi:hypothetical protein